MFLHEIITEGPVADLSTSAGSRGHGTSSGMDGVEEVQCAKMVEME